MKPRTAKIRRLIWEELVASAEASTGGGVEGVEAAVGWAGSVTCEYYARLGLVS